MKHLKTINKGYSIVESLVAITILILVITFTLSSLQRNTQISRSAEDLSIATFLAAEGIEYVRQIRDTNHLKKLNGDNSADWLDGIDSECIENSGILCEFDPLTENMVITKCQGSSRSGVMELCQPLLVHPNDGYNLSRGDETKYVRSLTFFLAGNEMEGGDILRVTSIVGWMDDAGNENLVTARENIFDW